MSLSLLDQIILRVNSDPNYVTKGSELTWEELDTNISIIANAIRELSEIEIAGVEPYDPGDEYSITGGAGGGPDYVTHDSNTWEYVNAIPSTGVTPGTDSSTWVIASQGIFSHERNKDEKLSEGTGDEVTAAEIRAFIDTLGTIDTVPTDGSANAVESNGVFDALALKLNLSGGTLTGPLRTYDGDGTNKALAIGGPATGFWRDRSGIDQIKWLYNGVDFLWLSETLTTFKNTLNLDALTASTILELDASKNIIAAAKATGHNLALGTTAGTVAEGSNAVVTTKISLSSAEILALNATPKLLLPAPGAGKYYEIISATGSLTFATAAYASFLQLQIYFNGAGLVIGSNSAILSSTANRIGGIIKSAISGASATQYLENTAIYCNVSGGNPTAGGGSLDLYLSYKIITL
jgi:hypothetical protein